MQESIRRAATPLAAPPLLALALWILLPRPGVWLDEAATVSATTRTWGEMFTLLHHQDASLSGYYVATRTVGVLIGGDMLEGARLVSGLAYLGTTAVVACIGCSIAGPRLAVMAGCVFALLPSTSASAVNGRPEALATLLIAVTYLAAITRRPAVQFVAGTLACWVYALDVLYVPLALLVAFAARPDSLAEPRRALAKGSPLRRVALTAAVTTVVGFVWLIVCSQQQAQVRWIHTSVLSDLVSSVTRVGFTAPLSRTHEQPALTLSVALGVLGALAAAGLTMHSATRVRATSLWATSLVPPLVVTLARCFGRDIFVERYFTPSVIPIAVLVGLALIRLPLRWAVPCGVAAVIASAPILHASHLPDGHWGEDLGRHRAHSEQRPVWFVSPRNRAVLFSDGSLARAWRSDEWWREARRDGTLWGPPQQRPNLHQPVTVVMGARESVQGLFPSSCRHHDVTTEARATSFRLVCPSLNSTPGARRSAASR